MRIHLGHHFYGAGNLGDDFMLAGFLIALRKLKAPFSFTASIPFNLDIVRRRFSEIEWFPYSLRERERCISQCDAWLGIGGSPFQSAQSRWFITHLLEDAEICRKCGKPMFYLGVGVQTAAELHLPEITSLLEEAAKIWTRDPESADKLHRAGAKSIVAASDLAHIFFNESRPPSPQPKGINIVANFDYAEWFGCASALEAIEHLQPAERIWLAQETRELPGAERALYAALPASDRARWRLVVADDPQQAMSRTVADLIHAWPTGEWLITSRYHAALAGVWAGSKIVVIGTNKKLCGVATEFNLRCVSPTATKHEVEQALVTALPLPLPIHFADIAFAACRDFLQQASQT